MWCFALRSRLGLPGKTEGIIFTPVPSETVCFEPERVGVTQLIKYTSPEGKIPVLSRFGQIERSEPQKCPGLFDHIACVVEVATA